MINSMIHTAKGQAIEAAWEQALANHLSGTNKVGQGYFQDITLARTLARIGQFRDAESILKGLIVEENPLGPAISLLIQIYRLSQKTRSFSDWWIINSPKG